MCAGQWMFISMSSGHSITEVRQPDAFAPHGYRHNLGRLSATGRTTGSHLHYEVRYNGDQVNPTAKQFNLASGLAGKQLAAFKTAKANIASELASLSKPQKLASR